MGKDKVEKKEKRDKKEKRSEKDGVHKSSKKDKKDKKDKTALADAVEQEWTSQVVDGIDRSVSAEKKSNGVEAEGEMEVDGSRPVGAVVPFANPLVEDKQAKKVLKSVKKGKLRVLHWFALRLVSCCVQRPVDPCARSGRENDNDKDNNDSDDDDDDYDGYRNLRNNANKLFPAAVNKCLKRGVKEVVKALRKSPVPSPNASTPLPNGVVVLAADISPMDVISHIPVLCEDHGIPYVFVTSRAELGNSAATKRPTSVTMVVPKSTSKGKKDADDDGEDFSQVYEELAKLAQKEAKRANV